MAEWPDPEDCKCTSKTYCKPCLLRKLEQIATERNTAEVERDSLRKKLAWVNKIASVWADQPFGSPGHDIMFMKLRDATAQQATASEGDNVSLD